MRETLHVSSRTRTRTYPRIQRIRARVLSRKTYCLPLKKVEMTSLVKMQRQLADVVSRHGLWYRPALSCVIITYLCTSLLGQYRPLQIYNMFFS